MLQRKASWWTAFNANGKSRIFRFNGNVTSRRYVNEALQPGLLPFLNGHNRPMSFMQDNAPAHRAIETRNWLNANNVQVFDPWPANTPDIENLLSQMERALQGRPNPPVNEAQLWQAVQEEWANINMFDVRRLVLSMRRRCLSLVQAAGGHTRY